MKKHVLPILLAFLLVIPAILLLWGFALPAQYGETFLGELSAQVDRLSESRGQRIILVGGSSVPFSLRCDLLEAALPGYTVIDFGLYADIGTSVMLELLEPEQQLVSGQPVAGTGRPVRPASAAVPGPAGKAAGGVPGLCREKIPLFPTWIPGFHGHLCPIFLQ